MAIFLLPLLLSKSTEAAPPTTEAQLKLLESRGFTVVPGSGLRAIPGYEVWWNDVLLFRCTDWGVLLQDPSKITEPVAQLVEQTSHWTRNPALFRSMISLLWSETQQPPQLIAYANLGTVEASGVPLSLTFHSIKSAVILFDSLGRATRTELLRSLTTELFQGVPGKTPHNASFRVAHVRESCFVIGCNVADGNNSHYEQLVEIRDGTIRPLEQWFSDAFVPARTTTPEGLTDVAIPETQTVVMSAAEDAVPIILPRPTGPSLPIKGVVPIASTIAAATGKGAATGLAFGLAVPVAVKIFGVPLETAETGMSYVGATLITGAALVNPVTALAFVIGSILGFMAGSPIDSRFPDPRFHIVGSTLGLATGAATNAAIAIWRPAWILAGAEAGVVLTEAALLMGVSAIIGAPALFTIATMPKEAAQITCEKSHGPMWM